MPIDQGVEAAQRVGLLKAAIGSDGGCEALVAENQPSRLVFTRMLPEEQHRRQMPEGMSVEVDARLLLDHALDLRGELRRRLGPAFAGREQESVRILRQHRAGSGEIEVHELAEDVRNLKGERCPVLHLIGWNDDLTRASRSTAHDVSADVQAGKIL